MEEGNGEWFDRRPKTDDGGWICQSQRTNREEAKTQNAKSAKVAFFSVRFAHSALKKTIKHSFSMDFEKTMLRKFFVLDLMSGATIL
jgi:hypothetical protein